MTIRMSWRDTRIKVASDNDNDTSALAKEVKEKGYVALNPLLARRIWVIFLVDMKSKIYRNKKEFGADLDSGPADICQFRTVQTDCSPVGTRRVHRSSNRASGPDISRSSGFP